MNRASSLEDDIVPHSDITGVIFDLGSTLIEYEFKTWPELSYIGQKRVYERLAGSDHSLPDFDVFDERLEQIKNRCRAAAAESLVEWRLADAYEQLLTDIGLPDARRKSRQAVTDSWEAVRDGFILCHGAVETLMELKRQGLRIGMISNTIYPGHIHQLDLDKFGLTPYIDFQLYSSEFGNRKPHPRIYREGLGMIGLPATATMFVGDRYSEDVDGPQKIGMSAVLKYREGRIYPDPLPEGFPVIRELPELLGILDIQK